jgi:hypothetical protein
MAWLRRCGAQTQAGGLARKRAEARATHFPEAEAALSGGGAVAVSYSWSARVTAWLEGREGAAGCRKGLSGQRYAEVWVGGLETSGGDSWGLTRTQALWHRNERRQRHPNSPILQPRGQQCQSAHRCS